MKQPNMADIMKQAKRMQAEMQRVQDELKEERVHVSAGGGAVKVTMTGELVVDSVSIDPEAVDIDDIAMLEDLITAAMNEAIREAQDLASRKMSAVTGGMGIPGLM
ncbi:MAG: YbaB/EbfC family nucleoid-associated protein [Coriobacteriales bacterium]|nr:YbaB/EbfC family nucleoid-associated protein [Actinomycetes bacterium]